MPDFVLYHVPPSFYSQIARLALRELEVPFEARVVGPGPPTFETYQPWYMKLNPNGTVPTGVHGDRSLPDSDEIMRYAASELSSVRRIPEDPAAEAVMEHWIAALRQISIRELSYGAEDKRKAGYRVNQFRLKNLAKRQRKHPELAEAYARKIEDIGGFAEHAVDPEVAARHQAQVRERLDELDSLLAEATWIAGEDYSLADTVWTVAVARLTMLKLSPLEGRPHLAGWYQRVKARPSFEAADVWEQFKVAAMLGVLARKFWPQLLLVAGGVVGLCLLCCDAAG